MSLSSPRARQCIFCQFKIEPRRLRRKPTVQTAFFSTSSRLRRAPATGKPPQRRRRDGEDSTPYGRSFVRNGDGDSRLSLRPMWGKAGRGKSGRQMDSVPRPDGLFRFPTLLLDTLDKAESDLRKSPVMSGLPDEDVDTAISNFHDYIQNLANSKQDTTVDALRKSYMERGYHGLRAQMQYIFYSHVLGSKFTKTDVDNQKALADLRFPLEWFPKTRATQRTVHVHIGPTNSGKTYHALKRLEQAKKGVYAGPLRLLAHEVYTRMNAGGKDCALVTGEEIRLPDGWNDSSGSKIISCTVEMAPTKNQVEVAVIDEIQMLADDSRGWAWTNAFIGIMAEEVHVCGEERALPLVERLAAGMGDKVIIHRYERLTTLKPEGKSLRGDLSQMRKGDCLVTFSVMGIHALRVQIEQLTGKRVAIIYGSLPPETRAAQARLFNDPDNDYDFLVASDAIGMGLNLSIKRVIFETIQKSNGVKIVTLTSPEIRQIAGRAGRYRVAPQNTEPAAVTVTVAEAEMVATALPELTNEAIKPSEVAKKDTEPPYPTSPPSLDSRPPFDKNTIGLVTTLEQEDYQTVVTALETPAAPLQTAGILPPDNVIHRFCNYFPPETPFSYILMRLHEICQSSHGFHLCRLKDQVQIADVIHDIQNLDVGERLQLVSAPVAIRDKSQASLIRALATCIAEQRGGALLELPCLNLEVLDKTVTGTRAELKELETLHKGLIMYMWLSFRFPGVFTTRPLANHAKGLVEGAIEKCLRMLNFQDRAKMRKKLREKSVLAEISNDLLKQEWVRNGDEGVIKNKGLEQELNVAADQVEAEDEGVLDSEGGLEAENIQEGTATHDIHNDDEGEYPEEDEGEDEDSTELDPTTLKSESSESTEEFKSWRDDQTQRNTETSTKEGEKSEIFEKADEAKPSVNIPFQSIKRQQGDARVQ